MSVLNNEGVLTPREIEIVARAVERLCKENNCQPESIDGQHLATRALLLFQQHRHFDEDALMGALRNDS